MLPTSYFYFIAYVFFVFFFTNFFSYDPEYFLFFTSIALFFALSINLNSFLESAIRTRYSIYSSSLKSISENISVLLVFSTSLENYLYNIINVLEICEARVIQSSQKVEKLFVVEDFIYSEIEEFYYAFVKEGSPIFANSRRFYKSLVFNQQFSSLILGLIQDHWTWKRRPRVPLSRYYHYRKFFNVPKKYPIVVRAYGPGEYKGTPFSVDL